MAVNISRGFLWMGIVKMILFIFSIEPHPNLPKREGLSHCLNSPKVLTHSLIELIGS
jgi:hypothetical protein